MPQSIPKGLTRDHVLKAIAECLVWEGQSGLLEKLDDQLLKYATWSDTKLALIVFNRNVNFTEVLTKMEEAIEGHDQRLKKLQYNHETGCRFLSRRADDPDKHFYLSCLAFDVPRKT